MTPERRDVLISALVEIWLNEPVSQLLQEVRGWLVHGRTGYAELSDEELLDLAEAWGWDRLGLIEEDYRDDCKSN
jgi:hypothetical protein